MKQFRIHQMLFPILVLAILGLLIFVTRMLWRGGGNSTAIAGLSAIAACFSSLTALLVATRNQRLEEDRRNKEKAVEKAEFGEKQAKLRRDIRGYYSDDISAWRHRRDLSDFIKDIGKAASKAKVFQHTALDVLLAARDSNRGVSGPEPHPDDLHEEVELASQGVASFLALSAFANFPSIPSIWTTQFKREDIDLLGESAPRFFVLMNLVWTNLTLLTRQIPSESDVVEFVRNQRTSDAKKYLEQLGEHIGEASSLFTEFLTVVDKCVTLLLDEKTENPLAGLEVPHRLIDRSAAASPNLAALQRDVEWNKNVERAVRSRDQLSKISEQLADFSRELDRPKAIFEEVRKKEQAALDEIEGSEK